jgi:hypothetical protein
MRILFAAGLLLAGCAHDPLVLTDRQPAAGADLDFVVMVRIEPGEHARQHEVFVGIGRHGDNPAQRYLHAEYTYFVEGQLDWRVRWRSEDRVELELSVDHQPLSVMTYVRDPDSGRFGELAAEGSWRQEAV